MLGKVRKKANIRNRYNQMPHLTQDTIWESGKHTRKHHTQESQEVSSFPASDQKDARNRQDSVKAKHKTRLTKRIHKRSTALERSVRKNSGGGGGLHMFDRTNLTLIYDVDKDK